MSTAKEISVQEREPPSTVITRTVKEGWVKKRSGRMHQWSNRYFILHDSCLSYKLKPDAATIRGTFNLFPGSVVTDIIEESLVKMKSNKLYSFWIVNPGAVKPEKGTEDDKMYDSDEENEVPENTTPSGAAAITSSTVHANRNLQHIVRNEVNTQKRQKELAEEQLELHQANDNNVSQGAYVAAAVAVGGVVVGAMTFGVGLIPYFAVVGITAAASGGVVAFNSRRRPENSRLIMAFESNKEAIEWKAAIEQQIRVVGESRRPMLPDSVDAKTISAILDLSSSGYVWKRVAVYEGVCVLEHITFERWSNRHYKYHPMMNFQDQSAFYTFWLRLIMDPEYMKVCIAQQGMPCSDANKKGVDNRTRKAQLSVCCSPGDTFLALMNTEAWCWPSRGTFKVIRELDDHADIIAVETVTDCTKYGGKSANLRRRMCMSRFWQLDDDGVYLVTYSSVKHEGFTPSLTMDDVTKKGGALITTEENCDVQFDAVVTIAPRTDVANLDSDIPESMVTCICQINLSRGNWQKGEVTALMESFLKDNLLELRETLWNNKYGITKDGLSFFGGGCLSSSEAALALTGAMERADQNDEGKLVSPPNKASRNVTAPAGLSPVPSERKGVAGSSGSRGYGVTTVQPGVEDEGGKTMHHLAACDDSALPAAVTAGTSTAPKKRMGFLQRMKSSSAAVPSSKHTPPPPPPPQTGTGASATTSPNGTTARKQMLPASATSSASSATAAQHRSVSPLSALLSRGKTIPAAAAQGNRSRNTSSDNNDEDMGDVYDSAASPPQRGYSGNSGGEFSPSNSPPSSPAPTYKKAPEGSSSSLGPGAPPAVAPVVSPPSKRPRDKKTNAEASKLRNVICMTDYEITRLSKTLKKRTATLQALESQHLQHQHQQQGQQQHQQHGHSGSGNGSGSGHGLTEEAQHQQTVLELNTEIQSLHVQIGRLTARQQGLKDEYLELTGEVFEPSKGTRGMMERWKGARLAAKEKEKDKHSGVKGDAPLPQPPMAAAATVTANSVVVAQRGAPVPLKRANSMDYFPSSSAASTAGGRPMSIRPTHWEPVMPPPVRVDKNDPAARSLIVWFGRMLSASLESDGAAAGAQASSSLRVSKSWAQRGAAEAAMRDVRAANLMLVLLFTASFVLATLIASCFVA